MTLAVIKKTTHEPSRVLRGIPAIREYWPTALSENPNLCFEIIAVFCGVDSVVVHYRGHRGLSAEFFSFKEPLIYSGRSKVRLKYSDSPTVGALDDAEAGYFRRELRVHE